MTTDCSLHYKFNTWKFQAQTWGEHVVYRKCFWHSEQVLYTSCYPHVLQKKSFLQRFTCTEFKFAHSMTQGVLSNAKSLKFKSSLTEAIPDLTDDLFVRENIAIIHIYHENLHFLKHERGEVCLLGFRIYRFRQAYYLWPFDK